MLMRIAAVLLALALPLLAGVDWLAERQDREGAWGEGADPSVSDTALSVLAFLGAGYTDRGSVKENPYAPTVRRGIRFLIAHPGSTARERALAALALSEAYWMTKNPHYKAPAQRALKALAPDDDPITRAFVVASLKSARFAKLEVPEEWFDRERAWLDANFSKHPAAALFSAVYLAKEDPRKDAGCHRAFKLMLREKPDDAWDWFFGTVGSFQLGGKEWKRWNESMRKSIVKTQRKNGSWDHEIEATALYTMCLSVYYRYDRVFGLGGGSKHTTNSVPLGPTGRSSLPPLASRIDLEGGGSLPIDHVSAEVELEGFRARVRLAFTFFYDGEEMDEGTFQLRLPDGASPHQLAFGSAPSRTPTAKFAMKAARMVDREDAHRAYHTIVREKRDPALLEWDGSGVFNTRVFPLEPGKPHRVEIGYDIDIPANGKFEIVLPDAKRPCDVRIGKQVHTGTTQRRFLVTHTPANAMVGDGYTAVRLDASIESATITGCTDVLWRGNTVVARGEAAAGATLVARTANGEQTIRLPEPVRSAFTPRVYGEIAVERMEPHASIGVGVPQAFARYFRVVRSTCSLVMLESEADYERFGIREKDDAAVVARTPATEWLEQRRASTPKQRLQWRFETLGKPLPLLALIPDGDFEGLPLDKASDGKLADMCERLGRLRLAFAYDELYGGHQRDRLSAKLLTTEKEGPWLDRARRALRLADHDLAVVVHWDAEDGDVDLHVVDPFGEVCNWRRRSVASGGRLFLDRLRGREPEVFRLKRAEPGEYVIRVNYFRPNGATTAQVVAIGRDGVKRAQVRLEKRDQMVEALRIRVR